MISVGFGLREHDFNLSRHYLATIYSCHML